MLVKNGVLCDAHKECRADLRINEERGVISEIGQNLAPNNGEEVLECQGKVVMPALIDIAYPKNQALSRKSLESLTHKALSGGVGSILLRPETTPRMDSVSIIEFISSLDSSLSVHFLTSIAPTTLESQPKLTEIATLISSGAVAIYLESSAQTIDGYALYKIAQYAQMLQIPVIVSPQEPSLSDGVMNESQVSAQLGLPAIPSLAQTMQVAKLCELARYSGVQWVFDVISEVESLQIIKHFTHMGARILAQTSLHHLILSDEHCALYDTRFKLFPPLKDSTTRDQLRTHLDSSIDLLTCLQSDSYKSKKDQVFESASFGVDALGYYFPLGFTHLVKSNTITLSRFSELTSYAQAKLLSLPKGALEVGLDADIIIADLQGSICVDDAFSPYNGGSLFGVVEQVYIGGKLKSLIH